MKMETNVSRFSRTTRIAVPLALIITVASGVLHARVSRMWGSEVALARAAERLQGLPNQIDEWKREGEYELGDSAIELLQCSGYLHQGYRNQRTGEFVKVAVMVGPGPKISIHVPEICFEATNYTLTQSRRAVEVTGDRGLDSFWSVEFKSNDVDQTRVRVLYGWNADGRWVAPRMPRWSVAGASALYKLQLSERIRTGDDEHGCGERFLEVFLPVLNKHLNNTDEVASR